jgi:RNA polymerase sigma-70 factor (sigma-E family)
VGDVQDPEAFCAEVYPRLAASLTLHVGDRHVGEELAQEALLRAVARWRHLQRHPAPVAWVYRVGFNLATSRFRRDAVGRRAAERLRARANDDRTGDDPATRLAVRDAVAALPPRQRAAVVLRYFADLSIDDAAEALGCAPGTVKSLTHHGLAALRTALGDAIDVEVGDRG